MKKVSADGQEKKRAILKAHTESLKFLKKKYKNHPELFIKLVSVVIDSIE